MSERVWILGVPIDPLTQEEAVACLRMYLESDTQHHVMTPNNEMLVAAARDASFRTLLQRTTLNLPDSTGLILAARFTGQYLPARVTGVDTVTTLCSQLTSDQPVFLLGAGEGVAAKAAEALKRLNPHITIAGAFSGSPRAEDAPMILDRIRSAAPSLLLVAFGAPAQDNWIADHLASLPSIRVAIGVGGTFDFLSGVRRRAPKMLRAIGLEWLWRLLQEPRRIGRICTAVIVFPLLVACFGRRSP